MRDGLVAALARDHGVHAYSKWRGAFWRRRSLADLGAPPGHRGVAAAAEQALAWLAGTRRLGMHERVVVGGGLGETREQGGLAQ